MDDATLHELFIADKPEEKAALVAESIIITLSEEAALITRRCSIVHWFDEAVITALSKDLSPTASELRNIYDQICALPFVEYVPWGLAFNSLTREGLLSRYITIQPALLITAAQLAATALSTYQDDRK